MFGSIYRLSGPAITRWPHVQVQLNDITAISSCFRRRRGAPSETKIKREKPFDPSFNQENTGGWEALVATNDMKIEKEWVSWQQLYPRCYHDSIEICNILFRHELGMGELL